MKEHKTPEKKPYTAPRIVVLGDIESITLGASDGDFTDAAFPVNTPRRDLTFS
jgi:hypothetical protein